MLQDECRREGELLTWIITGREGEVVARPVTAGRGALRYVLVAQTLAGVRAQLPPGLVRLERQPSDPPEMIEMWLMVG